MTGSGYQQLSRNIIPSPLDRFNRNPTERTENVVRTGLLLLRIVGRLSWGGKTGVGVAPA